MNFEPTRLEILLTRLAFFFCGKSVYQTFADRLPLEGKERVLDFGSGMGTVAYYVAKRLPDGHLTCLDISKRWLSVCRKTLCKFVNINYLKWESEELSKETFNIVYCHFVLHDISERDLERVVPALAGCLKPGGALVFREPLNEKEKIKVIKSLLEKNKLFPVDSRITDIPIMGNALESIYIKR